jgi:hypothetical protein
MENGAVISDKEAKKNSRPLIVICILLFAAIVFLLIRLWQAENRKNAITARRERELKQQNEKIDFLNEQVNKQTELLKEYKPYQAVVRSAALRDSIYKLLPYKFGETVYVMPDSTRAVVNSVQISGNSLEYSIKYWVRTSDGSYQAISIGDLLKVSE